MQPRLPRLGCTGQQVSGADSGGDSCRPGPTRIARPKREGKHL